MSNTIDPDFKLTEAIVDGWDGGKARAFEALRPYVRHIAPCEVEHAAPWDEHCVCGLRLAWRIRETPE